MAQSRDRAFSVSHRHMIRTLLAALILSILLLAAYGNTFHASWHYDDYANIVQNPKVHMSRVSWPALKDALSGGLYHQLIGRPLAYLSFALNYRFGALNVFGYHVVNLVIHWLAALFLFLFVRNLAALPALQDRYGKHADAIALIGSVLWASHPIQVTAVTYVVQRMTAMAGLFYIMAMYFYLKGRMAGYSGGRTRYFGLCIAAGLCALLSKENAILLVYALWLLDLMLIQGMDRATLRRHLLILAGLTLAMFLVAFLYTNPLTMFKTFPQRPYTQVERVLTEPRVLFVYLFLLVMPMTSHMGIVHDIGISHTLTQPWSTGWSIAGILVIIIGLSLVARKHPMLAFCGFFFFLNHVVEASFLNLELMYEHRNYIPSMLLFVPVGVAAVNGLEWFRSRRVFQGMIIGCLLVVIAGQLQTTVRYNQLFRSEVDTWSHIVITYPELSLGHLNLGKVYWDTGLFERARKQFETALEKDRYNNFYQKGLVYFNLGMFEALKSHDRTRALSLFEKSMAIFPDKRVIREIALNQLKLGQCQPAVNTADAVLDRVPGDAKALMIKAQALRCLDRRSAAVRILENLQPKEQDRSVVLLALVEIYNEMGREADTERCVADFMNRNHGQGVTAATFAVDAPDSLPYVPDAPLLERVFNGYLQRPDKRK